jgi:hypothetical protein
VRREALSHAALAGAVAALLLWCAPAGSDAAAHVYQRELLLDHGFGIWNNFWYAGRYSYVTYSLAYYPLSAALGIRPLALASVVAASCLFTLVVGRAWGRAARWPARAFAVAWAASVLSGAFPFLAASAVALAALLLLQRGRRGWCSVAILLTLALSPLAFALLAMVLVALAIAHRPRRQELALPGAAVAAGAAAELLLWRLFPDGGHYPFPFGNLVAACAFCVIGLALTWRIGEARSLRWLFAAYLAACIVSYVVPSAMGENVARLRYAAVPLTLLVLALRRWRPLPVSLVVLALAGSWNLTPLAFSFAQSASDPSAGSAYWRPAIAFLHGALTPDYRVEAVDTAGHWEATYLPAAGIPLTRGWFRQDDFPQNRVLYGPLDRRRYLAWLRPLAVRYVVLSDAPPDYSARREAKLLASGRSGLRLVFRAAHLRIYAVPRPQPLVRGPAPARVRELTMSGVVFRALSRGVYTVAVRYSPYWHARGVCVAPTSDGMTVLTVPRPRVIDLDLSLTASGTLHALTGTHAACG